MILYFIFGYFFVVIANYRIVGIYLYIICVTLCRNGHTWRWLRAIIEQAITHQCWPRQYNTWICACLMIVLNTQILPLVKTMTTFYIKRQLLPSILIIHNTMNRLNQPLVLHIRYRELGQRWFGQWPDAYSAHGHCLNQCWQAVNWALRNCSEIKIQLECVTHENACGKDVGLGDGLVPPGNNPLPISMLT